MVKNSFKGAQVLLFILDVGTFVVRVDEIKCRKIQN